MKKLHLLCNAHLDPVWMWEKDEGAAEVLSTYRVAADFCEEYDGFIFCHNESVLYEWVEELDGELFARIQKLVAAGRWKIMGGTYLQSDCNMPSGEGMLRQILKGHNYFLEKFGVEAKTAINFDSFGHSRGLVQIFAKAGYDSYIVCRPLGNCPLPAEDFVWVGYDGSELMCHRGYNSYESHRGKADLKVKGYMDTYPDKETGLVLWGIGNHGGGPSRIDFERISALAASRQDCEFVHSWPENYFADLISNGASLPRVEKPLHYHSVGCYTSQIRVKQKYRQLENLLFKTEKMLSAAALNGLLAYPAAALAEAEKDMLFTQFHDILPGTSIASAEEAALRQLDHGIEIAERLKIKAFLKLLDGAEKASDGDIPIFVYNPHPTPVDCIIECEFNLPDQNTDAAKWSFPRVYQNGKAIVCQVEHEESNFNVDWRKRIVFSATLAPSAMNRFDCKVELWEAEPVPALRAENGVIHFQTQALDVLINCATGAVDRCRVNGRDFLKPDALIPIVMQDDYDSWGNRVKEFRNQCGSFRLMSPEDGTAFSGIEGGGIVPSVRVIEDGDVRSIVEAVFQYNHSFLCRRYYLPKKGSEIKITDTVFWNENLKMLKLPIATVFEDAAYLGQVMYGRDELPNDGMEVVSQRWSAIVSESADAAVTMINNGTYGSDCLSGEARLSLLRSPGYSAGCSDFSKRKPEVMEQNRFNAFIDQGQRSFTFWLNFGSVFERLSAVELESAVCNESPFALSCFPAGKSLPVKQLAVLDNSTVQLTAFKRGASGENYFLRLFEPTGKAAACTLHLPVLDISEKVQLKAFEILTLELNIAARTLRPATLLETLL